MKKIKISLAFNITIFLLVTIGSVLMFTGIKFMPTGSLLEASNTKMLKYYTVDSNILVGVVSYILATCEILYMKKKIKKIPEVVYILKLVGASAITLTFLTTAIFLVPQYGLYDMYNNSNLFFHLIIPILVVVSYLFYEKHDNKYSYAVYGIMPMFLYSIYYSSMICVNLDDGGLTPKYDFYGFLRGNINNISVAVPVMFLTAYLISIGLIFINKKSSK